MKVTCAIHEGIHDINHDCSAYMSAYVPAGESTPDLSTLDRDELARMVEKLQNENERLKAEWSRATSPLETFDHVVSHAARMLHQATSSPHVTAEDDAADALTCCWSEIRALLAQQAAQLAAARAEVEQERATSERVLMQNSSRWAQLVGKMAGENDGLRAALAQVGEKAKAECVKLASDQETYWRNRPNQDQAKEARANEASQIAALITGAVDIAAIVAASATTLTPEMIAWLDEHRDDAIADSAEAFGEKFGIKGTAAGDLIVRWLALRKGAAEGHEAGDGKG